MSELKPGGPAPYTTAVSAITALDAYRDRGLGLPITAEVLTRAGVKETIAARTVLSLKQLGLIDDKGQPSAQFEELRLTRSEDEYHARLQEWLRSVYADVLQYTNPSEDHPSKVAEAFRGYEPAGQRAAMAGLLIGLWRYAGLPVIDPNSDRGRTERRSRPAASARMGAPAASRSKTPAAREPHRHGGAGLPPTDDALPPGLLGLLHQIPRAPAGWTVTRRDEFLKAFEAVLAFSVPVLTEEDERAAEDEDEEAGEELEP